MRKLLIISALFLIALLVLAFFAPIASGQWYKFWSKDKKYNLGSDPTIGSFHSLNENLGHFIVEDFDKEYSIMTISLKSGENTSDPGLEPNTSSINNLPACKMNEPNKIGWSKICLFKAKDQDKKYEYFMQFSWWYEDKDDIRVIVVEIKMRKDKLD